MQIVEHVCFPCFHRISKKLTLVSALKVVVEEFDGFRVGILARTPAIPAEICRCVRKTTATTVSTDQRDFHLPDLREIPCFEVLPRFLNTLRFWLKSGKSDISRGDVHQTMIISRRSWPWRDRH